MALYKELNILFPYLQTVRKLKDYLSFDVEFPKTWKLPKKYVNEGMTIENKPTNDGFRNISFVCELNEESVDDLKLNISAIIAHNKEREEKERLFELKVNELKTIFDKSDLDNLQSLKFEIIKNKLTLEDDNREEDPDQNGGNTELVQQ